MDDSSKTGAGCFLTASESRRLQRAMIEGAVRAPEKFFHEILVPMRRCRSEQNGESPARSGVQNFMVRLTGRCNLACRYCFDSANGASRDSLTLPMARQIAGYIVNSPTSKPLISFLGGEPLVNWEVGRVLIDSIRRQGRRRGKDPYFNIITNGTLITRSLARELVASDTTVQISIDGLPRGHDRQRCFADGSGSYEAAVRGLRHLRAVSARAKVDAQVVLTPGNTNLTLMARRLKSLGFRRINFLYFSPEGACGNDWSVPAIRELMRQRARFYPEYLRAVLRGDPGLDLGFSSQVSAQPDGPGGLCGCGSREVYIDTRGDIYPCPKLYGRAGLKPWGNCATRDPVQPWPESKRRPGTDCRRCWAYEWCGGGCAFQCQKCTLRPGDRHPAQQLWCDLLRAQFARAAITYHLLRGFHPDSLRNLCRLFSGD